MNMLKRNVFLMVVAFMMSFAVEAVAGPAPRDEDPIAVEKKTITDLDGECTVTIEWLRRPGEFALTIDYFGYLTQEGRVNLYLEVNGARREFLTLTEELPNRHQRIRILSFHPMTGKKGPNSLKKLAPVEVVDHLLFQNAPYYPQFGTMQVQVKFFAHGRWDGDSNRNNENFVYEFQSPICAEPNDHA